MISLIEQEGPLQQKPGFLKRNWKKLAAGAGAAGAGYLLYNKIKGGGDGDDDSQPIKIKPKKLSSQHAIKHVLKSGTQEQKDKLFLQAGEKARGRPIQPKFKDIVKKTLSSGDKKQQDILFKQAQKNQVNSTGKETILKSKIKRVPLENTDNKKIFQYEPERTPEDKKLTTKLKLSKHRDEQVSSGLRSDLKKDPNRAFSQAKAAAKENERLKLEKMSKIEQQDYKRNKAFKKSAKDALKTAGSTKKIDKDSQNKAFQQAKFQRVMRTDRNIRQNIAKAKDYFDDKVKSITGPSNSREISKYTQDMVDARDRYR